jgi:prolipoprotein diacylglyceryltransferase
VLALLGLLLWLRRRRLSTGSLFLTFVAWYGIGRLAEDFFRIDETHGLFLTSSQWAATLAVLTAAVLLITGRRPGTRVHEPGPLDAPEPERPRANG